MTDHADGCVIDVSLVLASLLDEGVAFAQDALDRLRDGFALVPSLFHVELANALLGAVRRNRIDANAAESLAAFLLPFDIRTDVLVPDTGRLLVESQRHGLTAYDTSYLLLAQDRGLPLATLDVALASAAQRAGVPLLA